VAFMQRTPCPLIDEIHLCILRALALYETATERKRRKLDLAMLDQLTWPEYVWEWLELSKDRQLLRHSLNKVPPQPRPLGAAGEHAGEQQGEGPGAGEVQGEAGEAPTAAAAARGGGRRGRHSRGHTPAAADQDVACSRHGSEQPPSAPGSPYPSGTPAAAAGAGAGAGRGGRSRLNVSSSGPAAPTSAAGGGGAAGNKRKRGMPIRCWVEGSGDDGRPGHRKGRPTDHMRVLKMIEKTRKSRAARSSGAKGGGPQDSGAPSAAAEDSSGRATPAGGVTPAVSGVGAAEGDGLGGSSSRPQRPGAAAAAAAAAGGEAGGEGASKAATAAAARVKLEGTAGEEQRNKGPAGLPPRPQQQQAAAADRAGGAGAAAADAAPAIKQERASTAAGQDAGDGNGDRQEDSEPPTKRPRRQASLTGGPSQGLSREASGAVTEDDAAAGASLPELTAQEVCELLQQGQPPALPSAALLAALHARKHGTASGATRRTDFWSLGPEANAAVLARLCDDLLDSGAIRAEIDRREAGGYMHAGKGGAGGVFAMKPRNKVRGWQLPGCP
jgi:hypothetical protein